ncbi:hypothetical protein Q0V21_13820 [Paenibacillus sp. 11B]|nr:hypothetical protein [Paenibacillus sp. 11B]
MRNVSRFDPLAQLVYVNLIPVVIRVGRFVELPVFLLFLQQPQQQF